MFLTTRKLTSVRVKFHRNPISRKTENELNEPMTINGMFSLMKQKAAIIAWKPVRKIIVKPMHQNTET